MASGLQKALKSNAQKGNNAVGDSEGIAEKYKNISAYKDATADAPAEEPSAPSAPSAADKVNPSGKYGSKSGEKRPEDLDVPGLPKLSKGAKIKKTRVVRVHAKEAVLPKAKAKKAGKIGLLKGLQTL